VQNIIPKTSDFDNERDDNKKSPSPVSQQNPHFELSGKVIDSNVDEDIALVVANGSVASHSLESRLGDYSKAVSVRHRAPRDVEAYLVVMEIVDVARDVDLL